MIKGMHIHVKHRSKVTKLLCFLIEVSEPKFMELQQFRIKCSITIVTVEDSTESLTN